MNQRPIEFRCWDSYENKMIYGEFGLSTGVICKLETLSNRNGTYRTEIGECYNGILLQYTGLKDKEGKKIFEGDILKAIDVDRDYAVVKYEDSGFVHSWLGKDGTDSFSVPLEEKNYMLIIGNIYENPDLLTK